MTNAYKGISNTLTDADNRRYKRNLILFIVSYTANNLISGILYDIYVNYLQEVNPDIARSFWAFYGYSTFIAAALLLLLPKTGFRNMLLICGASCSVALFSVVLLQWKWMFYVSTLLALTGIQLHYIVLAPYIATYTKHFGEKDIKWYTRSYYMGYMGYFLTTFLGGALTVKMFSLDAGISYKSAKVMTKYVTDMAPHLYASYLKGYQDVLIVAGVIATIAIIPVLFIKELPTDYGKRKKAKDKSIAKNLSEQLKVLMNKDAVFYLVYWMIVSFAMGLFTSYYTVFLNRNLHIDRATSSLLVSLSYVAMVLFIFFTPYCVRKLGTVGTICFSMLASVPFMIVIANGNNFGSVMIPVVGGALFMRAGLANLGGPADSALAMNIVPGDMRHAFNSMVNLLSGIISVLSGTFTGKFLFIHQSGYQKAYYIAGGLYVIATIWLLIGLKKKYNHYDNE